MSGHVLDLSTQEWKIAYLYDFKVDGSGLETKHVEWLKSNVIAPALSDASTSRLNFASDHFWWIGLMGTASRTASFGHNFALSKRRANAIQNFLQQSFATVRHEIDTTWIGEIGGAARGRPDGSEDALDRAVMIAIKKMAPQLRVPSPKIHRPDIEPIVEPIEVTFCFYAERAGIFGISNWDGELYAIFTHKGENHYYGWKLGGHSYGWNPPKGIRGDYSEEKVFAGYQNVKFPTKESLDRISDRQVWISVAHNFMQIRVKKVMSDDSDLVLKLKTNLEFEATSMPLGHIGERKEIPKSQHFGLPSYRDGKWGYHLEKDA